jgi:hypothetical protein
MTLESWLTALSLTCLLWTFGGSHAISASETAAKVLSAIAGGTTDLFSRDSGMPAWKLLVLLFFWFFVLSLAAIYSVAFWNCLAAHTCFR